MPAFQAVPGMPYWVELLTSDAATAQEFYGKLLGWEIQEFGAEYLLARKHGLPVAGIVALPEEAPLPDTWVTYFLVDEVATSLEIITNHGGEVLAPPTEVRLGTMAIAIDPAGALIGLVQPAGEEAFVAAGEPGTPVWHELTCVRDYAKNLEFYEELFGWSTAVLEGNAGPEYTTALIDGSAFAGVLDANGLLPAEIPSYWQSYMGVADVDAAAHQAAEFGGSVVEQPQDSAFGRLAIIADPQGAVLTLCEVAEPVAEPEESDPLEGIITDLP